MNSVEELRPKMIDVSVFTFIIYLFFSACLAPVGLSVMFGSIIFLTADVKMTRCHNFEVSVAL